MNMLDLLKQAAGRLALEYSGQMEQRTAAIVAERERMTTGLSALGLKVWPSQANFVLWRAQGRDSPARRVAED